MDPVIQWMEGDKGKERGAAGAHGSKREGHECTHSLDFRTWIRLWHLLVAARRRGLSVFLRLRRAVRIANRSDRCEQLAE